MFRIKTPFGPLEVHVYAGPTSAPGDGNVRDGEYPSRAHVFGRNPGPATVSARVESPKTDDLDNGVRVLDCLTINGVRYRANAYFDLTPLGWVSQRSAFSALDRENGYLGEGVTEGAYKAWRHTIVPMIVAALADASQEVTEAEAVARAKYEASVRERSNELRDEATRLDRLIDWRID